jgi:hypothetical protein
MSILTIQTVNAANRASATGLFRWLAAVIVCFSLIAAFRIGIDRGLRDTIGDGTWGRILFGVGTAITQMYHGGYGYALSNAIETLLTNGGLTSDPKTLASLETEFPANLHDPALINAAIDKAVRFEVPLNLEEGSVRGSGGDDLGFVDYVRLSFLVFGNRIQSLYYGYFLIFGISAAAFFYAFRSRPEILMLLVIASVGQMILFSCNLLAPDKLASIADPRFLGIMAVVPGLHLGCLLRDRAPLSVMNVALAIVQSIIVVFSFWIRASAVWVIFAVTIFAAFIAIRGALSSRNEFKRIWPLGVLIAVLAAHTVWVTMTLHPVYRSKGEISHHVFWHAVFYQLQYHPRWNEKYAAFYDFASADELPVLAAKKYLLRHPPLDPEKVYLTPDRQHLRIAEREAYIRRAFFELFSNDPRFVLESLLIYNPFTMARVFANYFSSLDQIPVAQLIGIIIVFLVVAGFLAANSERRRVFKHCVLLVMGGFFVSLSPILPTAPSWAAMGEQYFALLILFGGWLALALATGLRMLLGPDTTGSG